METTTKDYGFRYSFAGRAAWERLKKQNSDNFINSLKDNWNYSTMQDLYWILTYHQNKGAVPTEEIEVPDNDITNCSNQMLKALLEWTEARKELQQKKE